MDKMTSVSGLFFQDDSYEIIATDSSLENYKLNKERELQDKRECILYIEDEGDIAEVVQDLLNHLGYDVVATAYGTQAIDFLEAQPDKFDLIITDLNLPDMTGFDLSRSTLEIKPEIPILLCTGYNNGFSREDLKKAGIKGVILKPFSIKDIGKVIRSVLNSSQI
jgi:CheY-like chemotaxis protein